MDPTLDAVLRERKYEEVPIKVTAGVLLHIGAGIYNSVAGALKELVSNAYDADATRVVISTDYPSFEKITIVDNGTGMTAGRFRKAVQSIGTSLKGIVEPGRITRKYSRPIIGHLGIGLMALSQVCGEATIESQISGSDIKFIARLDFSEFRQRKSRQFETLKLDVLRDTLAGYGSVQQMERGLRELDTQSEEYLDLLTRLEIVRAASERLKDETDQDVEGEHLGYVRFYDDLPGIPGKWGTTITLEKVDPGVIASLRDEGRTRDAMPRHLRDDSSIQWDGYRKQVNDWSWEDIANRLRLKTSQFSYQSMPRYHQFLWELALMTPLGYLDGGPVALAPSLLSDIKSRLAAYNFALIVDNRRLLKPILLPSGALAREIALEDDYDYHVQTFGSEAEVDGSELKYSGYLFWQRKQVEPSSLRGIQIYIRNVGIGTYDQTLLGFSTVNPTSRAGQISGEVYVDEGLENALNVDRNSFRETDAHYVALQEKIWSLLGSATRGRGIMGTSVDAYWKRKERKEQSAQEEHEQFLAHLVKQVGRGKVRVVFSEDDVDRPYAIETDVVTVYNSSSAWPRSGPEKRLYQQLIVPMRVAVSQGASCEDIASLIERILLHSSEL